MWNIYLQNNASVSGGYVDFVVSWYCTLGKWICWLCGEFILHTGQVDMSTLWRVDTGQVEIFWLCGELIPGKWRFVLCAERYCICQCLFRRDHRLKKFEILVYSYFMYPTDPTDLRNHANAQPVLVINPLHISCKLFKKLWKNVHTSTQVHTYDSDPG